MLARYTVGTVGAGRAVGLRLGCALYLATWRQETDGCMGPEGPSRELNCHFLLHSAWPWKPLETAPWPPPHRHGAAGQVSGGGGGAAPAAGGKAADRGLLENDEEEEVSREGNWEEGSSAGRKQLAS